jgi:anti-sigma-K factor RskA
MDHNELRELTGAYALGALGHEERLALEAHLRVCPSCAEEVRETIRVVDGLAVSVKQIDPPPALRARVLNAVVPAPKDPITAPGRQRDSHSVLPYWLSAAAALSALALGLYALSLRNRIDALEEQLRSARAATATIQQQLISVRAEAADAGRRAAILTAPDVRRVDLAGLPPTEAASARAYWSPTEGLFLAATGLPAPPAGRVYQLWMVTPDQAAHGIALLTPDVSGRVSALASTPAGVTRVAALAVTLEPAGVSPAPTGDKVLVGLM